MWFPHQAGAVDHTRQQHSSLEACYARFGGVSWLGFLQDDGIGDHGGLRLLVFAERTFPLTAEIEDPAEVQMRLRLDPRRLPVANRRSGEFRRCLLVIPGP